MTAGLSTPRRVAELRPGEVSAMLTRIDNLGLPGDELLAVFQQPALLQHLVDHLRSLVSFTPLTPLEISSEWQYVTVNLQLRFIPGAYWPSEVAVQTRSHEAGKLGHDFWGVHDPQRLNHRWTGVAEGIQAHWNLEQAVAQFRQGPTP
jgi:hypothetical protein